MELMVGQGAYFNKTRDQGVCAGELGGHIIYADELEDQEIFSDELKGHEVYT